MQKTIHNLGRLTEKILIFGGPYSNANALSALQKKAEEKGISPQNCFCTGDIVGYCAESEKTVQMMKTWGAHSIQGNVEEQLITEQENCGCNFEKGSACDILSNTWYPKAKKQLSTDSLHYLSELPHHIRFLLPNGKKGIVVHGSFLTISEFIFSSTPLEIKKQSFDAAQADIIIAGHSGLPFVEETNDTTWINPGVIGMPAHNGKKHTYFGVFDPQTMEYTQETLEYDCADTAQKMRDSAYPECYAQTIADTGYWPYEDILPKEEKKFN